MEKLVVKTAVKTVLIILVICVVIFAVFNFAFPQHMASLMESMGNYQLALKYSTLRYSYTNDRDDLARCFDDSVLCNDDECIIKYGEQLLSNRSDFAEVVKKKNDEYYRAGYADYDYRHVVYMKLSLSYYAVGYKGKDWEKKQKAIALAKEDNGTESFKLGNTLMSLCARVYTNRDGEAAEELLKVLGQVNCATPQEQRYLDQMTGNLNNYKLWGGSAQSSSGYAPQYIDIGDYCFVYAAQA